MARSPKAKRGRAAFAERDFAAGFERVRKQQESKWEIPGKHPLDVARRRAKMKRLARRRRPSRQALPNGLVEGYAAPLRARGVPPHKMESEARKALEAKGLKVPTKPTLRAQLRRLAKKEN